MAVLAKFFSLSFMRGRMFAWSALENGNGRRFRRGWIRFFHHESMISHGWGRHVFLEWDSDDFCRGS